MISTEFLLGLQANQLHATTWHRDGAASADEARRGQPHPRRDWSRLRAALALMADSSPFWLWRHRARP